MINHPYNSKLSKEVYEACKSFMKVKECYTNTFHTIRFFNNKFASGEWKVAYGYIRILEDENLMARHCFIINKQGEAIDPTLFCMQGYREDSQKDHVSFFIFDDIEEYINTVEENEYIPDLISKLMPLEMNTSEIWAKENGYFLLR